MDTVPRDRADYRETKLEVRREPFFAELITALPQIVENVFPVQKDEMRQHEAIVKRSAPMHQLLLVWSAPEQRDECTHNQLLREAHLRMRRHLESAHFNETEPG